MRHCDSALHVSGRSQYIDDVPAPAGMLHGAVFGSPIAHGKILAVHTEAALEVVGVHAVYTFKDIPGDPLIGALRKDEPLLADDEAMFIGHPIALIIADSP